MAYPHTFGVLSGSAPTSYLDDNFNAVTSALGLQKTNSVTMLATPGSNPTAWIVYKEDGSILDVTGTTTQGLQEAINHAQAAGVSLSVIGGQGNATTDYGVITCSTGISMPPLRSTSISMRGVHLTFTAAVTGVGLNFDSMDEVDFELIGEIIYRGTSSAVRVKPTLAVPQDGRIFVDASRISISAIVAAAGTVQGLIEFDTSVSSIATLKFECYELNGNAGAATPALYGVLVDNPATGKAFEQNIIILGHVHLMSSAGVQIGLNATNQTLLRHNLWIIGGIKPAGATSSGFNSFGSNDIASIGAITNEEGTLQNGIVFHIGATFNHANIGNILGATAALADSGSSNTILGALTQITGTMSNNNQPAGAIGEYIESVVLFGAGPALTSGTTANITNISLTAGDWDVWGAVGVDPAGTTTLSTQQGGISTTSATLPSGPKGLFVCNANFLTGVQELFPVVQLRLSLSVTTTVYLVVQSFFGVSTMSGFGFIAARRRI